MRTAPERCWESPRSVEPSSSHPMEPSPASGPTSKWRATLRTCSTPSDRYVPRRPPNDRLRTPSRCHRAAHGRGPDPGRDRLCSAARRCDSASSRVPRSILVRTCHSRRSGLARGPEAGAPAALVGVLGAGLHHQRPRRLGSAVRGRAGWPGEGHLGWKGARYAVLGCAQPHFDRWRARFAERRVCSCIQRQRPDLRQLHRH